MMKAWIDKAFRRRPLQELPGLSSPAFDDSHPFDVPAPANHPFLTDPGFPAVREGDDEVDTILPECNTDSDLSGSFFSGGNQVALTAPLNDIFDTYRGQFTPFSAGYWPSANS